MRWGYSAGFYRVLGRVLRTLMEFDRVDIDTGAAGYFHTLLPFYMSVGSVDSSVIWANTGDWKALGTDVGFEFIEF